MTGTLDIVRQWIEEDNQEREAIMKRIAEAERRSVVSYNPRWTHDCIRCIFLGTHDTCDVYLCKKEDHFEIIARHGNDGPNYSCIRTNHDFTDRHKPSWVEFGLELAKQHGLLVVPVVPFDPFDL